MVVMARQLMVRESKRVVTKGKELTEAGHMCVSAKVCVESWASSLTHQCHIGEILGWLRGREGRG